MSSNWIRLIGLLLISHVLAADNSTESTILGKLFKIIIYPYRDKLYFAFVCKHTHKVKIFPNKRLNFKL